MKNYIQKNIMINPELWEQTKIFADISKENISSIIRKALNQYLEEKSKNNLVYRMRTLITQSVEADEQKDIEKILSKLTKEDLETGEIIEL